jgi:soluble lytic murein transglycosylase-like protein
MKVRWKIVIFLVFIGLLCLSLYRANIFLTNIGEKRQAGVWAHTQKIFLKAAEVKKENNALLKQNKALEEEVATLHAEVESLKSEIERLRYLIENRDKVEGRVLAKMKKWASKNGKDRAYKEVWRIYSGQINKAAKRYNVNAKIIAAIITVESDGNPKAESKAGAYGLMGLKTITADLVGVRDIFHPYENIFGGTEYYKKLLKRFGDHQTALVAYNEGPTKVALWLRKGFDPNTHIYVYKVQYLASL